MIRDFYKDIETRKMMNSYLVEITSPMQIPAVAIETRAKARYSELYVLLKHQEGPNIVRAEHEALYPREGISVVRRSDGGNTWYHSNSSRCLTWGRPESKREAGQNNWGKQMTKLFREFCSKELQYIRGDLFLGNHQVIGLSARVIPGARIHRACWYETDPIKQIALLLEADGVNSEAFRERFEVAREFFDYLVERLSPKRVAFEDYVSDESIREANELQKAKRMLRPKTCIGELEIKQGHVL